MNFLKKIVTIFIVIFLSCSEKNSQKHIFPKGYYRIEFPIKNYRNQQFNFENCNFSFDLPQYLNCSLNEHEKQITLTNPDHNISIYLSYRPIKNDLDKLIKECQNIVTDPILFNQSHGIIEITDSYEKFLVYEISGPVATPIQFHITDRKNHFLRGAMYIYPDKDTNIINSDSLKPVIRFFQEDIYQIINTINWSSDTLFNPNNN